MIRNFCFTIFCLFFFIVNGIAQENEKIDSLVGAFELTVDSIELIYHPIQKHFQYSQNKLVINQSSRELAATFDDPSRVLYRHAGISMANDQNNSIVYRGLPSEFVKWSVDGAEIVNPNHLSNAGRLSDQSSPSAGGVLAIPFEVVNKFSFYGNAYGPEKVSSLSAVSDFNLDLDGNNFFKVGLLGMEAGFQTKGKVKIKGNFRYSTVGLLSDFGVNFDGESIKFYDGFLKADITDKLSIIAIAGNSTNFKEALTNIEDATQLKDLQVIDFNSRFFIAGVSYKGDKFNHSLFASQRISERNSFIPDSLAQPINFGKDKVFLRNVTKYSYNGFKKFKLYSGVLDMGLRLKYFNSRQIVESNPLQSIYNLLEAKDRFVFTPYVNYKYLVNIGNVNFKLEPGLALPVDNGLRLDPSLFTQVSYENFILDINYSFKNVSKEFNQIINAVSPSTDKVESYSLGLKYLMPKSKFFFNARLFRINTEGFNYLLQSAINGIVDFADVVSSENSNVSSEGIEVMIDKSWNGGWYTHANMTFFDAYYKSQDQVSSRINTNENFKNIYNCVITKEFETKRNNKWIVNLAYHQRGGAYQNDFDFSTGLFNERRLSTYYRVDARFQYNWNKKNTLTLDVQNLTNKQNDAYYFFDAFLSEEVLEKQLGTIPILSYKRIL